jgi:isocitrate/isopropylmalate dehydrogenase
MLLEHLGETVHAAHLRCAVETCIAAGEVTPDLGGTLTTGQMTEKVIQQFHSQRHHKQPDSALTTQTGDIP